VTQRLGVAAALLVAAALVLGAGRAAPAGQATPPAPVVVQVRVAAPLAGALFTSRPGFCVAAVQPATATTLGATAGARVTVRFATTGPCTGRPAAAAWVVTSVGRTRLRIVTVLLARHADGRTAISCRGGARQLRCVTARTAPNRFSIRIEPAGPR